jgi:hypothetical protein
MFDFPRRAIMKTRYQFLAAAMGICLAAGAAQGEEIEVAPEKKEETVSFGLQALKERFEAAAPAIGEMVPDLSVYTAKGEKVPFRDLVLGHYSVVVFGCLT